MIAAPFIILFVVILFAFLLLVLVFYCVRARARARAAANGGHDARAQVTTYTPMEMTNSMVEIHYHEKMHNNNCMKCVYVAFAKM